VPDTGACARDPGAASNSSDNGVARWWRPRVPHHHDDGQSASRGLAPHPAVRHAGNAGVPQARAGPSGPEAREHLAE